MDKEQTPGSKELDLPKGVDDAKEKFTLHYIDDKVFINDLKNGPTQVQRRLMKKHSRKLRKTQKFSSGGLLLYERSRSPSVKRSRSITRDINDENIRKDLEYVKEKCVGSGAFSKVYRGSSQFTNQTVAMKIVKLTSDEGVPSTAMREISHFKLLNNHANIVRLIEHHLKETELRLILEYMPYDLFTLMRKTKRFFEMYEIKLLSIQLLRGLEYIHRNHIIHRDIKPQNLMVNESLELKITDFGLARSKAVPMKDLSPDMATLWYRPLDLLLNYTNYNTEIDIWSVGCVLYEIYTQYPLIDGISKENQVAKLVHYLGFPSDDFFPNLSTNEQFLDIMVNFYCQKYNLPLSESVNYLKRVVDHAKLTYEPKKVIRKIIRLSQQKRLELDTNNESDFFQLMNLIGQCLQIKGSDRISALNATMHPFFFDMLHGKRVDKIDKTLSLVDYLEKEREAANISKLVIDCNEIIKHFEKSTTRSNRKSSTFQA